MNSALFVIILVAFFLLLLFFFAVDVVTFVLLLFVYSSVPTKCIYIVRILAKSCACTLEVANFNFAQKGNRFWGCHLWQTMDAAYYENHFISSKKKKKKLIGKKIRSNIWPAPERMRRMKDTAKLTNYHP